MAKQEKDNRFGRFGTVTFTSSSKVNDFVDYLDQGRVMGTRCTECGIDFFPPRSDCSFCLKSGLDWFNISDKTGTLLSFSKMKYGPQGFESDLPYTIAVADFGSFKMFGRLSNEIPETEISIGMAVSVAVNPLNDDRMNFVFKKA
jgi:uncharacterized OB-fold protein